MKKTIAVIYMTIAAFFWINGSIIAIQEYTNFFKMMFELIRIAYLSLLWPITMLITNVFV